MQMRLKFSFLILYKGIRDSINQCFFQSMFLSINVSINQTITFAGNPNVSLFGQQYQTLSRDLTTINLVSLEHTTFDNSGLSWADYFVWTLSTC